MPPSLMAPGDGARTQWAGQCSQLARHAARATVIALLALCAVAPVAHAAPSGRVVGTLLRTGEWLVHQLREYAVHEAIGFGLDALGITEAKANEQELKTLEKQLEASLAASAENSAAKQAELREQLHAADIQLAALRQLQTQRLSAADTKQLRDQVEDSMQRILTVINEHERRLDALERDLNALKTRVAQIDTPPPRAAAPYNAGAGTYNAGAAMLPPSFNCGNARTGPEKLICNDRRLGDADGRLGIIYENLRFFLNSAEFIQVRDDERRWIRWRDDRLATDCARGGQVDMNCAIGLWETRIVQLQGKLKRIQQARGEPDRASGR
ncbi:lysozyme inhibitor LprI family protein [Cupriavidus basilensis]